MNEMGQNDKGTLNCPDKKMHSENAWKKNKEAAFKKWSSLYYNKREDLIISS